MAFYLFEVNGTTYDLKGILDCKCSVNDVVRIYYNGRRKTLVMEGQFKKLFL